MSASGARDVPPMTVSALRDQLQRQWAEWDVNGDGTLDAADLVGAYDTNGDGILDMKEMEKLAAQLSNQVEYNNTLLEQLQRLEEQQLATAKDVQQKQQALRQALDDVAQKMSDQARQARVEAGVKAREAEGLQQYVDEARQEIGKLKEERAQLLSHVGQLEKQATSMRAEWCNNEDKGKQRIGQLEADLAAAKAELEELRARYAPMARQQQAAREQVETLQDELAAVARRAEDKQAALSRADARIAELEKQARDGAAAMQRASAELDEACAQRSVAEHQLAAAHESAQAQAEELRRSHHVAGELTQRLAERGQEVSQLRADLETASKEMMGAARAHEAEADQWQQRVAELEHELQHASRESREREKRAVETMQRRTQEYAQQRRAAEEQYTKLQTEFAQLNDLMRSIQQEHAQKLAAVDDERQQYEAKIAELKRSLATAEEERTTVSKGNCAELQRCQRDLQQARAEVLQRTQRHVGMLSALQSTLRQLATECAASKEEQAVLAAQVHALSGALRAAESRLQQPAESWHAEARGAMQALARSCSQLRKDADEARDAHREAELQAEEERSKSLMLEEQVSRLGHELAQRTARLKEVETAAQERAQAAESDLQAVSALRDDLEAQLQRTLHQLEAANAQCRALQSERARTQAALDDARRELAAHDHSAEEQASALRQQLRTARVDLDAARSECGSLRELAQREHSDLEAACEQLRELEAVDRAKGEGTKAALSKYQAQVATLNASLQKFQAQLKQTQSLLQVVQEQRQHLQDDNAALRAELDEVYRTSLGGMARSSQTLGVGSDASVSTAAAAATPGASLPVSASGAARGQQ